MTSIDRFDHMTLVVNDVATAVQAYAILFGRPPVWRGGHPELGTEAALFSCANGLIELTGPVAGDARAEGMRALLATHGEGPFALAFGTPDADACFATLRERGVPVAPPEAGIARSETGDDRAYRALPLSPRRFRGLTVLAVEREGLDGLLPATRPAPGTFDAIDHVVIRTADPEAALSNYGEALGLRLALDRDFRGTRMLFFRLGGVTIEVVQDASMGERDVLHGAAYRVRDLDACHQRLDQAGVSVSAPRAGNKPGTRVMTIRDHTCEVPTLVIEDPSRG